MNVKTGNIPTLPAIKDWLICPRCKSGGVTHIIKTDTFRCKRCGAEFTACFETETTEIIE